jgi:hypothetical protein
VKKKLFAEIANARSLTRCDLTVKRAQQALAAKGRGKQKHGCFIMIIDEIELLLPGRCSETKDDVVKLVGRWANNPDIRFALIGISNSVGDKRAKTLKECAVVRSQGRPV